MSVCPAGPTPEGFFGEFIEGRRGEILDAALAVFAEKGYEAGTMRDIASRIGVTEPALYRHYAGKEALLVDLISEAGARISSEADRRLADVQPENLRASIVNLLHMRRKDKREGRNIMGTLLRAAPHSETLRATFREKFGRPMVGNVTRLVTYVDTFYGIERTAEEREIKVRAFMSLFTGYFMTSMFFDEQSDDAIVSAMLSVMGWEPSQQTASS
jgi:AcrR family transcriptional regulator